MRASDATVVEVTVRARGGRAPRPGLRIHRAATILDDEIASRHGIPVTTPARTVLDLAAVLQRRHLERALDRAEILELTDVPSLDAMARAHPSHRGASRLRDALETHTPGTTVTRSELEERFLALCDAAGLARPRVNAWVAGLEVDFVFDASRVVVEVDGWRYHRRRSAFERDRERDAALTVAGYQTLRFSHHQLAHAAQAVTTAVATALATRRAA